MTEPAIAGLILSGGASSRMGTPKALLRIGAETFIDRLIGLFSQSCNPVIVVLGHDAEAVRSGMESRVPVMLAVNPQPERGMLSSLQCGLLQLPRNTGAVLFSPVDYPSVQAATVARIAAAFRGCDCDVALPAYLGKKGHPVCVTRRVVESILSLPASGQARDAIRSYRERTVLVDVDDPGIATDIDTPQAYHALVCVL